MTIRSVASRIVPDDDDEEFATLGLLSLTEGDATIVRDIA